MAKTPLNLIASFKALPGREDELRQILERMVEPTRAEEGCLNYDLHQNADDPSRFVFYEGFTGPEALAVHASLPHFQRMMEEVQGVAEPDEQGRHFTATVLTMVSDRSW